MYPIGHVAFSYLVARPVVRKEPTMAEFAALAAGTVLPAVSNVAMQHLNFIGVNHFWSHSPLLLVPLGILGILAYTIPVPLRRVPLFFALGVASHLISDIIFDFPLIYLSDSVDDIGGPWFFPWRPILIRYRETGFDVQLWELILEGLFLLWALRIWRRWDTVLFGAIALSGTMVGLLYGL